MFHVSRCPTVLACKVHRSSKTAPREDPAGARLALFWRSGTRPFLRFGCMHVASRPPLSTRHLLYHALNVSSLAMKRLLSGDTTPCSLFGHPTRGGYNPV